MGVQYQMAAQFPPVTLLPAAADAAGRTGVYASLRNALKAWVIVEVNQGNAATVALTLLQATSSAGAGSKALGATPIWLNDNTAASDALVAQAAAAGFTTDANTNDKLVLFEIEPEACLDMVNGFNHIAVQTGASNAANVTAARLHIWGSVQGASPPTTIA
jgi:hypothetical protein